MDKIHYLLVLLVTSGCFIYLSTAQFNEEIYECYAYGDPHVVTWYPKSNPSNLFHPCYENGFFELVRNEYIFYKVQVSKIFTIDVEVFFYNGTSRTPICMAIGYNFEFELDDETKCNQRGITWTLVKGTTENILTISYARAQFSTIIRQTLISSYNTRHYNIHVWQPKSLVDRSTGICHLNDKACLKKPSKTVLDQEEMWPVVRSVTEDQARLVCNTYIDKFLGRSQKSMYHRSDAMNSTISLLKELCELDVTLTGMTEMAQSSVDVLMIEELTADVTSVNEIKNVIDTDLQSALNIYQAVVEESGIEVSQLLGLSTLFTETTSAATPPPTSTTSTTPRLTSTTSTTAQITSTAPTTSTTKVDIVTTTNSQISTTNPLPLQSLKCGVYQNMYIQTWHSIDEALPPSRICSGSSNFEIVKNPYIRFTILTNGTFIEQSTLILFDRPSAKAVCTIIITQKDADWMECEEHGIYPHVISTATYESLSVTYATANFTSMITRDVGINIGRFSISVYLSPESAIKSTGVCNRLSPCV